MFSCSQRGYHKLTKRNLRYAREQPLQDLEVRQDDKVREEVASVLFAL